MPRVESIQNEFSLINRSDDPYVAEVCVTRRGCLFALVAFRGRYFEWKISRWRKVSQKALVVDVEAIFRAYSQGLWRLNDDVHA